MDRALVLARLNGTILRTYSARTVSALRSALPLRVALPYIEPVLALNVDKEIQKDTLIICRAGTLARAGESPAEPVVRGLFAETLAIDDDFLHRIADSPVRVVIRYDEIEPVRVRRIRRLLESSHRVIAAWKGPRLRAAVRAAYSESEFALVLSEILDLYSREARALARSVGLPALLRPLREKAAFHLASTMSDVGFSLASAIARGVYRV